MDGREEPRAGKDVAPPERTSRIGASSEDLHVGQIAVEWKLISPQQLAAGFRDVDEGRTRGLDLSLGDLLVQGGSLRTEDLLRIHRERARRIEGLPDLPKYHLGESLGEGATAVVYRAWDKELKRTVAIKVLRSTTAMTEDARRRFRREAQTAASLAHPNLVSIFDAGESNGHPYLIMELVEGRPLDQALKERPLPERERVALLEKVARGMSAAHARGIIHRDLKPANILVSREGEPKVTDFGLAHVMESPMDLTRTGAALGTPLYMAPEQVEGRSRDLSPATDVYSLGAILYEVLTGQPPHRADSTMELYGRILREAPIPARERNPAIAGELEEILRRALQKAPEDRYANAGELADRLKAYLDGSSPAGGSQRAPAEGRAAPRPKGWLVWSAAGMVVLGTLIAFGRAASSGGAPKAPALSKTGHADEGAGKSSPPRGPEEPPGPPSAPPIPGPREGLLAYWKLDEQDGATAKEYSGRSLDAHARGAIRWGSSDEHGLEVRDDGAFLEIPPSPDLETLIQGSYTLSAWFQPSDTPKDKEERFGIIAKSGSLCGLVYTSDQHFALFHFTEGWAWCGTGTWATPHPPGRWFHVVGVLDQPEHTARIYINGERLNQERWNSGGAQVPSSQGTWKIGMGNPQDGKNAWSARGTIREVRIYGRTLDDAEVKRLYQASPLGRQHP